jgi:hypothetical protein
VNDPGHGHVTYVQSEGAHNPDPRYAGPYQGSAGGVGSLINTTTAKTGISIENLPAKSTISVSVGANDAGEHLPLVYVLICQKVA